MKKVLSLILALAMVFALAACGEKQPASDGDASGDGDKPARGNVIMTFGTADTGGSMYPGRRCGLPGSGRTTSRV